MKRIINKLTALAALALFSGCSDNNEVIPTTSTIGKISIELTSNGDFEVKSSASSIAIDDFTIKIIDNEGTTQLSETYGNLDPIIGLPVARDYTIIAEGGVNEVAAFDSPYYYGSTTFDVYEDLINSVVLTSSISNVKITVNVSDEFKAYYGNDWDISIRNDQYVQDGDPELVFNSENEDAEGYIQAGNIYVYTRGGSRVSISNPIETNSADHQILNVSLSESGSAKLYLTVDNTLNEVYKEYIIPTDDETLGSGGVIAPDFVGDGSSDEGSDSTLPTIVGEGFDIDEIVNIDKSASIPNVIVNINAPEKISSLFVTIDSDEINYLLPDLFGGDTFDLANPTDDQLVNLIQFQILEEGEVVKGATSFIFDVTPFISLLGENGGETHNFSLKLIDELGNEVEKTLALKITE